MEEHIETNNFIEQIVVEDLKSGKHESIYTRFPPEPNGYLHIGHAMAIYLNFTIAQKFGGKTNLRFDDTNPETESTEYVDSIRRDVKWLGFEWEEERFASDYFEQLYQYAIKLINKGLAYVDDSTQEEIAAQKGNPMKAGTESPYRNRSIEENLDLFEKMRKGAFEDGSRVLRAKIDMTSPNMHMRDPIIYRIKHMHHHRTENDWPIYPMYDFAHGQSDSIEGITHSLCSFEFENHRPLYNWFIKELEIFPSRQIEFSRRNVTYMITSKRKLLKLVNEGLVSGWDDPRMPTVSGMRRRGFSPDGIKMFCDKAGISKRENIVDVGLLEECIRQDLNKTTDRIMAVMNPLKVIISNYPEGKTEMVQLENNPEEEEVTHRDVPFGREIYIDHNDFAEEAPNRKYRRLAPGRIVRLKGAYIIECESYDKNEAGEITAVYCKYFDNSRSGNDQSGLKPKGTLSWVEASNAVKAEARIYDRLFTVPQPTKPEEGKEFIDYFNHDSLKVLPNIVVEPSVKDKSIGERLQFLRIGYFCIDEDSKDDKMVFNQTVTLKDTWSKK